MKTHTTLTCDVENIQRARRLGVNLSAEFNEFLGLVIARKTQNTSKIDLELEKMKLKQLTTKLVDLQAEMKVCQDNIDSVEELNAKKEQAELESEKERLRQEKSCINCGSLMGEKLKKHQFNNGMVCHSCFMSSDAEMVKKWNNG